MKHATIAGVVALACVCVHPDLMASDSGWASSIREALRLGKAQNKPIMIEFNSPYCGPCKKMEREVFTRPEVKAALAQFVKVKADVMNPDMKAQLKQNGLNAVPAFVFKRPNGKTIAARQDLSPALPDEFLACVTDILKREKNLLSAQKMAKAMPNRASTLHRLGEAYADVGEVDLAREQFEKVIALQPHRASKAVVDAHCRLGELCLKSGDAAKAGEHFDAALKLDPENKLNLADRVYVAKGKAMLEVGDFRQAYKSFECVMKIYSDGPYAPEATYWLGKCYERMGNSRAAQYTWRRCAQMYPKTKFGRMCADAGR